MTAFKDFFVSLQLNHTECRKNIRHITFILSIHNIIFPRRYLVLLISVLCLTVKWQKHILLVYVVLVKPFVRTVNGCAALSSSHIFNCVKTEVCKIGNFSAHFAFSSCAKGMCAVCHNNYSSEFLLNFILWLKHAFLSFNSLKNSVIITDNTRKVNRNDCLCIVIYGSLHFVIIHLKAAAFAVNHNGLCTDMINYRRCSCVSICR